MWRLATFCREIPSIKANRRLASVLLEHHLSRLDHHCDNITLLQCHLFGASPGDHAFNEVLANAHDHMSHHAAKLNLFDGTFELIASGKCHAWKHTPALMVAVEQAVPPSEWRSK